MNLYWFEELDEKKVLVISHLGAGKSLVIRNIFVVVCTCAEWNRIILMILKGAWEPGLELKANICFSMPCDNQGKDE